MKLTDTQLRNMTPSEIAGHIINYSDNKEAKYLALEYERLVDDIKSILIDLQLECGLTGPDLELRALENLCAVL